MPTGYTAAIVDGISFGQYALNCARAFGALVAMRDEPADATIPDEFKPSDHHEKAIAKAAAEISDINSMTVIQLSAAAKAAHEKERTLFIELIEKKEKQRVSYEAMLEKVNAWAPPTPEHQGLKDFMAEQIKQSIEFDCGDSYYEDELNKLRQLTADEWKVKRFQELKRDLEYHEGKHQEEVRRASERTQWVKALRLSLT